MESDGRGIVGEERVVEYGVHGPAAFDVICVCMVQQADQFGLFKEDNDGFNRPRIARTAPMIVAPSVALAEKSNSAWIPTLLKSSVVL
jgi:hypothetical protein